MSTSANHGQGQNPWGTPSGSNPLGTTLGDFGQSRAHYQQGYMMSAAQHNIVPQNIQHTDEIPTVPTKAKMNLGLSGRGASNFGVESMFESTTSQRQTFADQDAPPTTSIHDIFNQTPFGASERPEPRRHFALDTPKNASASRQSHSSAAPMSSQIQYVIVFGYPPDKYSATVEYFKSIGDTTEPEPNTEITNCFRIGYREPAEAIRAVRRNGEIISGSWMVGVKWADSMQAELLGASTIRSSGSQSADFHMSQSPQHAMSVDEPSIPSSSVIPVTSVGTPIKLAPSVAAFRKAGSSASPAQHAPHPTPAANGGFTGIVAGQSPTKGMLGQVSDLLFGW
ncbi:hypothetical protein BJ138DRAFT_1056637 [Hygrophoropsis aurantiaca]|uniref:Uncharacterized protein n=1 Tax=Hygrophoropsis aurantiaca TaxID=72124 RepID=A0ACB8AMJ7_9AGAM|nr:hypothetical protein BJ138DRAFT_1056637 [Hygrophoropsis aurantiaca]